eukprot:m.22393 g.22393  ORF g.22393 m.22393 type:complete len:92 (-) comp3996_c0_seq2:148-423(-)
MAHRESRSAWHSLFAPRPHPSSSHHGTFLWVGKTHFRVKLPAPNETVSIPVAAYFTSAGVFDMNRINLARVGETPISHPSHSLLTIVDASP